jgi:hypothetical protein
VTDLLLALRDVLQVNPWLAALWLVSAFVLASLIVYGWRRLLGS